MSHKWVALWASEEPTPGGYGPMSTLFRSHCVLVCIVATDNHIQYESYIVTTFKESNLDFSQTLTNLNN